MLQVIANLATSPNYYPNPNISNNNLIKKPVIMYNNLKPEVLLEDNQHFQITVIFNQHIQITALFNQELVSIINNNH